MPIKDYVSEKILDKVFKNIQKHFQNKKILNYVDSYSNNFKEQIFELIPFEESFDWHQLQTYIKSIIFKEITYYYIVPDISMRNHIRKHLYNSAYARANAYKVAMQRHIDNYIKGVMEIIRNDLMNRNDITFSINQSTDAIIESLIIYDKNLKLNIDRLTQELTIRFDSLTQTIEYKNSFAEMIDNLIFPQPTNILFHYRNESIGFYGRKEEFKFLDNFLDNDASLLSVIITGTAGSGKSRLLYEYSKTLSSNPNWKAVFIQQHSNFSKMVHLLHYDYPTNLLIVVDYASKYLSDLKEFILLLSNSKRRPPKTRIVLLERTLNGNIWSENLFDNIHSSENILDSFYSTDNKDIFMQVSPLRDEDLRAMAKDYFRTLDKQLAKSSEDEILLHCKKIEKTRGKYSEIRPLIMLFVADSYLETNEISELKLHDLLGNLIKRYKKYWKSITCRNNNDAYIALMRLLVYATGIDGWETSDKLPPSLNKELGKLQSAFTKPELEKVFGELSGKKIWDEKLSPIEPDMLGEYFVLDYLKSTYECERNEMVSAFEENVNYFKFLHRCIDDYSSSTIFDELFNNEMKLLVTDNILCKYPSKGAELLYELVYYQEYGVAKHTTERIYSLIEYKPEQREDVIYFYCHALNILSINQNITEAEDTVVKLKQIIEEITPESEKAGEAYAYALYNLMKKQNDMGIRKIMQELRFMTVNKYANNEKIAVTYAEGLLYLSYSDEKNLIDQIINELWLLLEQRFTSCEKIAIICAKCLFRSLSIKIPTIENVNQVLERLNFLSESYFNSNEEIAQIYANALYISVKQKRNKIFVEQQLKRMELLSEIRYEKSEKIALFYANMLYTIVKHNQNKKFILRLINRLESLAEDKFKKNEQIASYYAKGLFYLSKRQNKPNAMNTINKIYNIFIYHPHKNDEIALAYACGIFNQIRNEEPNDAIKIMVKLENIIYRYFKDSKDILTIYAKCLSVIINKQDAINAEKTLEKLRIVAEGWCARDNEILMFYAMSLYTMSFKPENANKEKSREKASLLINELHK